MKSQTSYDFKAIEKSVRQLWNQPNQKETKTQTEFRLIMPPPNVTGSLHLGHALNNFLQDTLVRFAKLQGKKPVWIPGFDHAGIATEIMVKKWIAKNGWIVKDQNELEQYFEKWVHQQKTAISHQWDQLGLMINQDKLTYTFSPQFQKIVEQVFVDLYQKQLIYQAKKLVNFDLKLQTVLSDIEVVHQQKKGKLYYIKYWNKNKTATITIATTRPETIFADQALLIHPRDQRWKKWKNQFVINPLTDQLIPVYESNQVDPHFGSGVVKCTPGHDFNDFKIGKTLNLKNVTCFNKKGLFNDLAKEFAGYDRLQARTKIVEKLQKNQQLEKVVTFEHTLPYSSKSNTLLEPILSNQWFLKTEIWAKDLLGKQKKINFTPQKYQIQFVNWLKKCEDWCISRQLSWGHKMPVYFHQDGQIQVSSEKPQEKGWKQSSDVLDTWFSSALWSLVNSGWTGPKENKPILEFHFDYLVTSYDIIFFWVTKMLFFHDHFQKTIPFQQILIHGLVRNENNEKMSKSKGNTLDPLTLIEEFGVDSLRLYLLGDHKIGEDLQFQKQKLIQANQFCNKLWNISQFVKKYQIAIDDFEISQCQNGLNHYLYQKWQKLVSLYRTNFPKHRWSLIIKTMITFIWKNFSNFYLPLAKALIKEKQHWQETQMTINFIWKQILLLLHPFAPFISEFIWQQHFPQNKKSILENPFIFKLAKPVKNDQSTVVTKFLLIIDKMSHFIDQKQTQKLKITIHTPDIDFYQQHQKQLNQMLATKKMVIIQIKKDVVEKIVPHDKEQILTYFKTKITFLEKELNRSNRILNNQNFLQKAKKAIIDQEKEKQRTYQQELNNLLKNKKNI